MLKTWRSLYIESHVCTASHVHTCRCAHFQLCTHRSQAEYITLSSAPAMFIVSEFKHEEQVSHIIRNNIIGVSWLSMIIDNFASILVSQFFCFFFRYFDKAPKREIIQAGPWISGLSEQKKIKLVGGYWIGRKTTGTIEMHFWKKEQIHSYPEEMGTHPVSEVRGHKR